MSEIQRKKEKRKTYYTHNINGNEITNHLLRKVQGGPQVWMVISDPHEQLQEGEGRQDLFVVPIEWLLIVIDELVLPLWLRGETYAVHDGAEDIHQAILEDVQRHILTKKLLATEVELPLLGGITTVQHVYRQNKIK